MSAKVYQLQCQLIDIKQQLDNLKDRYTALKKNKEYLESLVCDLQQQVYRLEHKLGEAEIEYYINNFIKKKYANLRHD